MKMTAAEIDKVMQEFRQSLERANEEDRLLEFDHSLEICSGKHRITFRERMAGSWATPTESPIESLRKVRDAALAETGLERQRRTAAMEMDAWRETAHHYAKGTEYFRGLLIQIGEMFGEAAYISDDGSKQDEVLCAKVPELVRSALNHRQYEERQRVAQRRTECATTAIEETPMFIIGECRLYDSAVGRAAAEDIAANYQPGSAIVVGTAIEDSVPVTMPDGSVEHRVRVAINGDRRLLYALDSNAADVVAAPVVAHVPSKCTCPAADMLKDGWKCSCGAQ